MSKKILAKSGRPQNLASLVHVDTSPIHGQGLFAVKKIRKGTLIGRCEVKPSKKQGPYTLWDSNGRVDVVCDLRFINHAEKPNVAIFEDLEVIALRDIKKGEELTHQYDGSATL